MYSSSTFWLMLSVAVRLISRRRRQRFFRLAAVWHSKRGRVTPILRSQFHTWIILYQELVQCFNQILKGVYMYIHSIVFTIIQLQEASKRHSYNSSPRHYPESTRDHWPSFDIQLSQIQSPHRWHQNSCQSSSSQRWPSAPHTASAYQEIRPIFLGSLSSGVRGNEPGCMHYL